MSWISKFFGLDKNKKLESQVNNVGNLVLHGIEESSALYQKLVPVVEEIGQNPPVTPMAIATDLGLVISIFDPNIEAQANAVTNTALRAALLKLDKGITEEEINIVLAEVDNEEDKLLESLGMHITPSASAP